MGEVDVVWKQRLYAWAQKSLEGWVLSEANVRFFLSENCTRLSNIHDSFLGPAISRHPCPLISPSDALTFPDFNHPAYSPARNSVNPRGHHAVLCEHIMGSWELLPSSCLAEPFRVERHHYCRVGRMDDESCSKLGLVERCAFWASCCAQSNLTSPGCPSQHSLPRPRNLASLAFARPPSSRPSPSHIPCHLSP